MPQVNRSHLSAGVLSAFTFIRCLWPLPAHAAEGPFAAFDGTWNGSGLIAMKDGSKEKIRCRVSYQITQAGNGLAQDLVCASDSYRFNIASTAKALGNAITGTWSESTRGVSGSIQGRVGQNAINANVDCIGFSAAISIQAQGRKQVVTIKPDDNDIALVSAELTK